MEYALTMYPLSRDFRERLEQRVGVAPTYLNLTDLRKASPLEGLSRLRAVRGRLILPIEDEDGRFVLPLLKTVAGIASTRTIEVVYPDLRSERVSRLHIAGLFGRLVAASALARRDAWCCQAELNRLLQASRPDLQLGRGRRILYLNANLWFGVKAGGSVGHIAGVVNALQEVGYDVSLASVRAQTMIHPGVEAIALLPPPVFGLPYEVNYYRFQRLSVEQLLEGARRDFSFLYQRMSVGSYTGVVLSRRWQVPLVLEYNGSEVWVAKHWGRPLRFHDLASRAEKACLRHAQLIVTVSDVLGDELVERGVPRERIVVYPNCVDPATFNPGRFSRDDDLRLRATLGLTGETVIASFIATFGRWHGVDLLARAIRTLVDEETAWLRQTKLHFLLIGDGLQMAQVRATLACDRCAPFLTLTGLIPQSQAASYLNISDFVLSPHVPNADGSRFFGSPTKLFEYMAMAKAIVASDLHQIGHVLKHSLHVERLPGGPPRGDETELAVLVEPGNASALIRGIKFLASQPGWRELLGRNARREALRKYTWRHHVDAIMQGLERLPPSSRR